MRKLDEIKSVDELTFVDYYNYKAMMTSNKKRIMGKSEFLYLLPLILGVASLGLLPISLLFLTFSVPVIFVGTIFGAIAGKSMYVNYCQKRDNTEYALEYKRLKKAKQLGRIKKLMKEFENTDRFKQSSLEYQVAKLESQISYCETLKEYDQKHVDKLSTQLEEKRGMLSTLTKKNRQAEEEEIGLDAM